MLPQIKFDGALNSHSTAQFLNYCAKSKTKGLRVVQQFFAHVIRAGFFFLSPNLQINLISTYIACNNGDSLQILTRFFKCLSVTNPGPFNSILSNFSGNGSHCFSIHTFSFMHANSVSIDSYALCSTIKSVSCLKRFYCGKMLQAYVEKSGWLSSVFVGSALVHLYSKSLSMNNAVMVFDEIPVKNTVCANALLSGYAEAKMWSQGIELVRRLPQLDLPVDNFTLSYCLRACTGLCVLELGKQVHGYAIRSIIDVGADVFLQSLLIEMYGRCGVVDDAKKVFDMTGYGEGERQWDVVLWTSILGVCGRVGNYAEVVRLFKEMLMEGIKPDGVAFLTVISACGHTGQVDLGMEYFESMTRNYGLVARQEHYSCVVDMLCRAGELERAFKLVSEIPDAGNESCAISMWGALLSACSKSGDVGLGRVAGQRALELEPDNVGIYVQLSNLFAGNGMWTEIEQLRDAMRRRGLKKDLGWSYVNAAT